MNGQPKQTVDDATHRTRDHTTASKSSRGRGVRAASGERQDDATAVRHGPSSRVGRGYSWPPFEPGNTVSVRHGANSARMVRPVAQRIEAELLAAPGLEYLGHRLFAARLAKYAWACARVELVKAWCDRMDWEAAAAGREGHEPPLELLRRLSEHAARLGAACGLTPLVDEDVQADIDTACQAIASRTLGDIRKELGWMNK